MVCYLMGWDNKKPPKGGLLIFCIYKIFMYIFESNINLRSLIKLIYCTKQQFHFLSFHNFLYLKVYGHF